MGAWGYTYELSGADLQQAFTDAQRVDRDTYGSDPYTGTIKQATGCIPVTDLVLHPDEARRIAGELQNLDTLGYGEGDAGTWNDALAERRAQRIVDELGGTAALQRARTIGRDGYRYRGWEPASGTPALDALPRFVAEKAGTAAALPVGAPDRFTVKQRKVSVDLLPLGVDHPYPHDTTVMTAIAAALPAGSRIGRVELVEDKPTFKTSVAATKGKVVTGYGLYVRDGRGGLRRLNPAEFPSLPAARSAATELVKAPVRHGSAATGAGDLVVEILGQTRREDGSGLVRAERTLVARKATYTVQVVTAKATVPIAGWLVIGTAAS